MKIISDFYDYFDSLMDPTDQNDIFIRKQEKITFHERHSYARRIDFTVETIGFCGHIYPFYLYLPDGEVYQKIYWDWAELEPIYEKGLEKYYGKTEYKRRKYKEKKSKKKKLGPNDLEISIQKSYFRKYKCAYFHRNFNSFTIYPVLKDFQFYKIFPPAQAYQEIEKFLFGILAERKEYVPPVSNKDLIEAKGFCLKTSFRKEKENA